jgi:outer membrane protein assembly factor BamB
MKITKLILIILLVAAFCFTCLSAEIINPDKPLKGVWNFKAEKLWQINGVNDDGFALINQVRVSDSGKIFVHDGKMKKYYILSPEGKLLHTFGKEGEGPGEIKWIEHARMFPINDQLIIADSDNIHYFSEKGEFIRSVRNSYFQHRPSLILNRDEFLSAPMVTTNPKNVNGKIKLYNLKTAKESVVANFSIFRRSVASSGGMTVAMVIGGVTPLMILGHHDGRIYYGMNSEYKINVSDMKGKVITSFGVDREPIAVPAEVKKKMSERDGNFPKKMLEQIVKGMPDVQTYFERITIHNGLIYVRLNNLKEDYSREFDIFSPDGKYLYRAKFTVEEGYKIKSGQSTLIKDGFMYVILEDEEEEEAIVAKYKIALPSI